MNYIELLAPMKLLHLFALLLCGFFVQGMNETRINNISTSSGIFYENFGKVKYFNTQWTLMVYVEFGELQDNVGAIQRVFNQSLAFCDANGNISYIKNSCNRITHLLKIQMDNVVEKSNNFFELFNVHKPIYRTEHRDWFQHISKKMLGEFDAVDEKRYEDALNSLSEKNENVQQNFEDNVQVVKSSILDINDYMQDILEKSDILVNKTKTFDEFIIYLKEKLNGDVHEGRKAIDQLYFLKLILDKLEKQLDSLTTAIIFSNQNILHPKIITSEAYLNALFQSQPYLPSSKHYPFPLLDTNIYDIMSLSTLQVFYLGTKLVFANLNPLVDETTFDLYRLLPLPTRRDDGSHVFIQPKMKYLAIDENNFQYVALDDLKDCKETRNIKICKYTIPPAPVYGNKICETEILSDPKVLPKTCDILISPNSYSIMHRLANQNAWLYVFTEPEYAKILCDDLPKRGLVLEDIGILTISKNCKVHTRQSILMPSTLYTDDYIPLLPKTSIVEDQCCKSYIHLDHTKSEQIEITNGNWDVLQNSAQRLTTIANDINADDIQITTTAEGASFLTVLNIMAIVCIFIYLLYKLTKYVINRRNENDPSDPDTPLQHLNRMLKL